MKRLFTNVCIVLILIGLFNCFLNFTVYADEEKYYDVQIPIFYGTTENFTTELLSGFTTSEKQKEGVIFVSLEDFQKLTDVEIKEGISNSIILKRNTVYLDVSVNSGYTTLSLGLNEDNLKQCIYLEIPIKEQNDTIYISLLHGLNAFGIEANILNEEDITSIISINEKILGKDFTTESLSYLENSNIFDFNTYPYYLQISMAEPFDKFFLEFINNRSDYLFSWDSLFLLNNTTSSLGSLPSYFISNQDGITDYLIGQYEPDERYYNVLFNIISNGIPDKNTLDISQVYKSLNFMNDTGIIDMILEGTEVQNFDFALSYTISSVANAMEASERTINLFRCSEFEKNVLNKTLLSSDKLKVEMMDDKIITDSVRKSLFNKYIYNNYLSSFYNNQYALYRSAYRLNNDIKNPIENISAELYSTLIYNSLTSLGDYAFNEITYGFTGIADTLMQNIKHNSLIKDYVLDPSETIGEIKDCYFIQDTAKNLCSLSIFDEFENSYYNFRLILQSSLTAYELLSKNEELLRIIGEDGKNTVTSKINNINSILEDISKCDTDFYMTENIWSESEIVKNISTVIVSVDFAKEVENYSWHLEPTIEANDSIVSDDIISIILDSSDTWAKFAEIGYKDAFGADIAGFLDVDFDGEVEFMVGLDSTSVYEIDSDKKILKEKNPWEYQCALQRGASIDFMNGLRCFKKKDTGEYVWNQYNLYLCNDVVTAYGIIFPYFTIDTSTEHADLSDLEYGEIKFCDYTFDADKGSYKDFPKEEYVKIMQNLEPVKSSYAFFYIDDNMKNLDEKAWKKYLKESLSHYSGPVYGQADTESQTMKVDKKGLLIPSDDESDSYNDTYSFELYDWITMNTFESNPIDFLLSIDNGLKYNETKAETYNNYAAMWITEINNIQNTAMNKSKSDFESLMKEFQEYNWCFMKKLNDYSDNGNDYERKYEYCKQEAKKWIERYKEITGMDYDFFLNNVYSVSKNSISQYDAEAIDYFDSMDNENYKFEYYGLPTSRGVIIEGFTMFKGEVCYTVRSERSDNFIMFIPIMDSNSRSVMNDSSNLTVIQKMN